MNKRRLKKAYRKFMVGRPLTGREVDALLNQMEHTFDRLVLALMKGVR